MKMQEQSERIFTKVFLAVSLVSFLIMMAYYMLFVITGPFAQQEFNAQPSTSGLVAGLMVIGSFIGRFWGGHFVNRIGTRASLLIGLALYCAGLGGYVLAGSLAVFLAVRLVSGIGVGCINTVTGTFIAHILPAHKHGEGISYFSLSTVLAMAVGPFAGLLLQKVTSYDHLFLLCLAGGLICSVLALLLPLQNTVAQPSPGQAASSFSLSSYLDSRVALFSVFALVAGTAYGNMQAFMAAYAGQLNLTGAASSFFLVYALVVFITRPSTGKIFDTRGEHYILYPALLALSLGFVALSCAEGLLLMLLAGALIGAGFGNIISIGQVVALRLVAKERFAQATSTFYIMLDAGIGFGPFFFGMLVPRLGYRGVFFASTIACLLSALLYHLLHGKRAVRP